MAHMQPVYRGASPSPPLVIDNGEDHYNANLSNIPEAAPNHGLAMGLEESRPRAKSTRRRASVFVANKDGKFDKEACSKGTLKAKADKGDIEISSRKSVPFVQTKALGTNDLKSHHTSKHGISKEKESKNEHVTEEKKQINPHVSGSQSKNEDTPVTTGNEEAPWRQFEDYIRTIELDTLHFQTKPFARTSSDPFKSVMGEMQSAASEKRERRAANTPCKSIKVQDMKKSMEGIIEPTGMQKQEFAKAGNAQKEKLVPHNRGWRLLQKYVKDMGHQKHKRREMGLDEWNFITTSTVKTQLTGGEKARQDLYDRYLNEPNAWTQGFSSNPRALLDRMKVTQHLSSPNPHTSTSGQQRSQTADTQNNKHRDTVSNSGSSKSNSDRQFRVGTVMPRPYTSSPTKRRGPVKCTHACLV